MIGAAESVATGVMVGVDTLSSAESPGLMAVHAATRVAVSSDVSGLPSCLVLPRDSIVLPVPDFNRFVLPRIL